MSENNASTMNLNKKLFELRKYVDVVKKSKKGYGYTYASIVEILAKLKAGMDKYQLLLEEECVHGSQKIIIDHYEKPKVLKDGSTIQEVTHEFVVSQDIIFTWVDVETGESKQIPWTCCGEQADPSQAQGGGFTYAQRQFLTQYFQIATPDDDPDYYRSQKEEAEAEANMAVTKQLVTKIDTHVHSYLDANNNSDEARKKLTDLVKKYVRNGTKPSADYVNYLTDPTTAAMLLEELKKQCPLENGQQNTDTEGGNG